MDFGVEAREWSYALEAGRDTNDFRLDRRS